MKRKEEGYRGNRNDEEERGRMKRKEEG